MKRSCPQKISALLGVALFVQSLAAAQSGEPTTGPSVTGRATAAIPAPREGIRATFPRSEFDAHGAEAIRKDPEVPGATDSAEKAVAVSSRQIRNTIETDSPMGSLRPADTVLERLRGRPEHGLLAEVLERNPEVSALAAAQRAAEQRAPQASALPDPMAAVTAYLWRPETRVGPQRFMGSLSERFPWFGKLHLREQAALAEAAAARARLEATRLRLVTEGRRLYDELAFLQDFERVVGEDRATLVHYEELARARYASGFGLEQPIVKIQAEITKDDARLLDIATRRASLLASVNALRDRPVGTPVEVSPPPRRGELHLDLEQLRRRALTERPEVVGAESSIARAQAMLGLARKERAPDVTLGLSYTSVGGREDPAGRLSPPPDDGKDILAFSGGINLPIWRRKLTAGIEEALQNEYQAQESKRAVLAAIDRPLGDLFAKIPLTWQRLRLFEDVLLIQADQSLRSAEAGYTSGTLAALDLLDAERVLLEVRIQASRTRTDYEIAIAELEGAVGAPTASEGKEESKP
jgi:outer membrane protein, heavy metal efflux system